VSVSCGRALKGQLRLIRSCRLVDCRILPSPHPPVFAAWRASLDGESSVLESVLASRRLRRGQGAVKSLGGLPGQTFFEKTSDRVGPRTISPSRPQGKLGPRIGLQNFFLSSQLLSFCAGPVKQIRAKSSVGSLCIEKRRLCSTTAWRPCYRHSEAHGIEAFLLPEGFAGCGGSLLEPPARAVASGMNPGRDPLGQRTEKLDCYWSPRNIHAPTL